MPRINEDMKGKFHDFLEECRTDISNISVNYAGNASLSGMKQAYDTVKDFKEFMEENLPDLYDRQKIKDVFETPLREIEQCIKKFCDLKKDVISKIDVYEKDMTLQLLKRKNVDSDYAPDRKIRRETAHASGAGGELDPPVSKRRRAR